MNKLVRAVGALVTGVGLCAGLASCSGAAPSRINYVVDVAATTTNAGSASGTATTAAMISSVLYPSFFTTGPEGQVIPNKDLGTAQQLPGRTFVVEYHINDTAVYSDGQAVTCDDFYLAHRAAVAAELYRSDMPLLQQVDRVECTPHSRNFRVVFRDGFGPRWRSLFEPGTVVPAHVVASSVDKDLQELRATIDEAGEGEAAVATAWNDAFQLKPGNEALGVAAGPYRINEVTAGGVVELVANESYPGDKPDTAEISIYRPQAYGELDKRKPRVHVADLRDPAAPPGIDLIHPPIHLTLKAMTGRRIEQLVLARSGVLSTPEARRALAACTDVDAVAKAASPSDDAPAIPMRVHLASANTARFAALDEVQRAGTDDPRSAADALRGQTVRIGYVAPNRRQADMVEAITHSCNQYGITVQDVAEEGLSVVATRGENPSVDAFLTARDPLDDYPDVPRIEGPAGQLRAEEERLRQDVPSVPLNAEPRTFAIDQKLSTVIPNATGIGAGWNMSRWK